MRYSIPASKPFVDKEDIDAAAEAVASGMHGPGRFLDDFENAAAGYLGCRYGKATSSGLKPARIREGGVPIQIYHKA